MFGSANTVSFPAWALVASPITLDMAEHVAVVSPMFMMVSPVVSNSIPVSLSSIDVPAGISISVVVASCILKVKTPLLCSHWSLGV